MINLDLEKQIAEQIKLTVTQYVSSDDLQLKIQSMVQDAVGDIIGSVASKIYAEVSSNFDIQDHITKIVQLETNQNIHQQSITIVREEIAKTPVNAIIEKIVKNEIDIKFNDFNFPEGSIDSKSINWHRNSLSGSYINGGIISNFASTGIDDKSDNVQLTILKDHVVAEGEFTATNITATDTIQAKNLSLTGTLEIGTDILDHGPFSQLIQQHSQMIVDDALTPFRSMLKEGQAVINADSLLPSVTQSNLRKVGNLQDLSVIGDAKFSETLFVSASGKVGINTEEPRGALTVRDEDAEISFLKTNRRTMYIGSTRNSGIEIGTNNQSQLVFKENLIEMNNAVRVMGIKFSVSGTIPEHEGEPNEVTFVLSGPKFYMCLGGNKWQAL